MTVTYDDITDMLLSNGELMPYCLEGTDISPLCIGIHDGKKADCFLVSIQLDEEQEQFSWKIWAKTEDWEKIEIVSEKDSEICRLEDGSEPEMIDRYMELYPEIRQFAFQTGLTEEQKELLREFCSAWKGAVEQNIREKLEKTFSEFFEWERQMM